MVQKWPNRKLEEVCAFQNGLWTGKRPPFVTAKVIRNTNFKNNDGTLNFGDVAEIEVEKKQLKNRLLEKGDLILERSGGGPTQPVGRVVYFGADCEFSFSDFTTRIRVKNSKELYSVYLWRYLNLLYLSGVTEKMQKQTTGIRNLNFSEYKELEIPLPPIAEQKKIVAKLEKVLGKIKEAKRLRAEAQEAAQNLLPAELHRIFSQQHSNILQNVGMSGKSASVKTSVDKWEEKELGEVAALARGPFGGSLKKDIFVETGDCVYEQGNVIDGDLENFRYFITPEKFDQMKRFAVSAGDVLMSCSGTIGRFAIIPKDFKKGIINQALLKITPSQKITSEFLKATLENYFSSNNTHVKGMAIKNIAAVKELKKIKIPLPPIAEQKKIVARLNSLSEKTRRLQEYQNSTASDFIYLEQSVLHKAFSGKM